MRPPVCSVAGRRNSRISGPVRSLYTAAPAPPKWYGLPSIPLAGPMARSGDSVFFLSRFHSMTCCMTRVSEPEKAWRRVGESAGSMRNSGRRCQGSGRLLILVFAVFQTALEAVAAARQQESRPNVILIQVDDADWSMFEREFGAPGGFRYFPNIARLADEGMRFTNFHATTPICGPSRACLLSGRYAHQLGIKCNEPELRSSRGLPGGYEVWKNSGPNGAVGPKWIDSHLGVWMQYAGYRTMLVGKYLHSGFQPEVGQEWVDMRPPGWDDSYISLGGDYFGTTQLVNGMVRRISLLDPADYPSSYRTDVEATDILRLVREQSEDRPEQPFFLYYAPLTPHRESAATLNPDDNLPNSGMIAPRHRNWWTGLIQPLGPDFNEWDMSDKPDQLRDLPALRMSGTTWRNNDLMRGDNEFRRRMCAMRAVDDFVRDLRKTLQEEGLEQKTVIIFTSDNGYTLGQQRTFGKGLLLDRHSRVPLFVWGPGWVNRRPEPLRYLLANVDLAPTILDLAESSPPFPVAGKSFLPLLNGSYRGLFRDWRPEGVLLEHWQNISNDGRQVVSTQTGMRMFDSVYLEWATGEREYYDLRFDPMQLFNRADSLAAWELDQFQNLMTFHRQEIAQPVSHIEFPFSPESVAFRKARISGTAEFTTDVREVRLVIRESASGNNGPYWNGTGWQTQFVAVPAQLAGNGFSLINWTYDFDPQVTGRKRFVVTSRAYGDNGSFQQKPDWAVLWLENDQPYGEVEVPAANSQVKKFPGFPTTISGWASDDAGVKTADLILQHAATGKYWNGSDWQNPEAVLAVSIQRQSGSHTIRWSHKFLPPDPAGAVHVTLRVVSNNQARPTRDIPSRFSWAQ